MSIKILINPPKSIRPEGAIRADVGWKLFMPGEMGEMPKDWTKSNESFKRWLWNALSMKLGFLKPGREDDVYILTPGLSQEAVDLMVRTCSFWSNEVYAIESKDGVMDIEDRGDNLWTPPIVNILDAPGSSPAIRRLTSEEGGFIHSFLSPVLGSGRSNARTYTIAPDNTFSRFHSHTAREELYFVLKGRGSVRIAGHKSEIKEGDLISKPTGPDIPTQLIADMGEELKILDIEIWPDPEKNSKDVIHYTDHRELDLSGEGWDLTIPSDNIMSSEDSLGNYNSGYERLADGSWKPKDLPGMKKREK